MRTSCEKARLLVKSLLLLSILTVAVGCGKEGTLTGKVYYKEQLVKAGSVNFVMEGSGKAFASEISRDGTYSVSKVPPGKAKIAVVTGSAKAPDISKTMGRGGQKAQQGMEKAKERLKEKGKPAGMEPLTEAEIVRVPEKYGDADKSGLEVTVTGGKQVFDIKVPE